MIMTKTYSRHNCNQQHQSWPSAAKCIWRFADIGGDGPYAVYSRCRRRYGIYEVRLFSTLEEAKRLKQGLDPQCGGTCQGGHDLIVLAQSLVTERRK
jgi:hypothetical protein